MLGSLLATYLSDSYVRSFKSCFRTEGTRSDHRPVDGLQTETRLTIETLISLSDGGTIEFG
jgi:hypothetical protein